MVAKNALSEFPPLMLGALRFSFGGLFILPIFFWFKRGAARPGPATAGKLLLLGLSGVGANQLLFLLGLQRTSVAHAAILIAMTPVMVLLLSAWAGHEHITPGKLTGLGLALGGVAVLQGRALLGGGNNASMLGDVFVLLASLTFAIFTVVGKEIRERYDGLTINTFAYAGSTAILSPFTFWLASNFDFSRVTWVGWLSVAYMATFPSVIAYLIFYHALRYMPSSKVSRLAYLQPFFATLLAVPVLGEKVTVSLVTGGALVLAGVFWAERQ